MSIDIKYKDIFSNLTTQLYSDSTKIFSYILNFRNQDIFTYIKLSYIGLSCIFLSFGLYYIYLDYKWQKKLQKID